MIFTFLVLYIFVLDFIYTYENNIVQFNHTNENITINPIHIVYALDHKMVTLTMISVKSIIETSLFPSALNFHFVTIGMTWDAIFLNEMRLSLGASSNFEATVWTPPPIIKKMKVRKLQRQDLAAAPNYARFYVSKLFPSLTKFIYLDNDVIAIQPLDELWNTDLGATNILGMVHDCGIWYYDHVIANMNYNITHPLVRKVFGHYEHQCHPNAGVMLVNQTLYKEYKVLTQVEELIKLNSHEFIYKLGSQPLIVLTSWNNYLPLPNKWNVRNFTLYNDSSLLHFNGKHRKLFMYNILSALTEDYVHNGPKVNNAFHMKGVQLDQLDRIWDHLAVKTIRDSTEYFARYMLDLSRKTKLEYEKDPVIIKYLDEKEKLKKKLKNPERIKKLMYMAKCGKLGRKRVQDTNAPLESC